jgi:hypothetical protein
MSKPIERLSIVTDQKEEGAALGPDPFDLKALRIPVNYAEEAGIVRQLTTVPIRKPHRHEWIRVHPDSEYRNDFHLIKLGKGDEFYLVHPDVRHLVGDEAVAFTVYTAITKANVLLLWPVSLPSGDDRRPSDWVISAHAAAAEAVKRWVRVKSNKALGAYETYATAESVDMSDPVWPDKSMPDLLRIAFGSTGRLIQTVDHPVIRELQGR